MRLFFTLFLSLFAFASHAIYKGVEEKDPNGIRNVVVLSHFDNKPSCSGTLIAADIIATTAWCAIASRQLTWFHSNKTGARQTLNVSDAIIHPDFDPAKLSWGGKYIALLKLNKPVTNSFGDFYKTIPDTAIAANETVTIAGFGRIENENAQSGGVLRSATLQVDFLVKPDINTIQYLRATIVDNNNPISSACRGDWGGPVIGKKDDKHILYGMVVSNSPPRDTLPNTCGGQTFYIHYAPLKNWIEQAIENLRKRKTI